MNKVLLTALIVAVLLLVVLAADIWLGFADFRTERNIRHRRLADKLDRIDTKVDELDSQVRWARHTLDDLKVRLDAVTPADGASDESNTDSTEE